MDGVIAIATVDIIVTIASVQDIVAVQPENAVVEASTGEMPVTAGGIDDIGDDRDRCDRARRRPGAVGQGEADQPISHVEVEASVGVDEAQLRQEGARIGAGETSRYGHVEHSGRAVEAELQAGWKGRALEQAQHTTQPARGRANRGGDRGDQRRGAAERHLDVVGEGRDRVELADRGSLARKLAFRREGGGGGFRPQRAGVGGARRCRVEVQPEDPRRAGVGGRVGIACPTRVGRVA